MVEDDGRIVVFGNARTTGNNEFLLVRYENNGRLDRSFGIGGIVTTDVGGDDYGWGLARGPGSRLVAAGGTIGATNGDIAVVRYLPGACVVPRLVGRTQAQAAAALAQNQCRLGTVRRTYSVRGKKGRVVAQSHRAGTTRGDRARVNIVVSRGARPKRR